MMEILKKQNNRYCLLDEEGEIVGNRHTGKDFTDIKRINDQSNYYCLWKNDVCFYLLYVKENTVFIGGSYPQCFKEIRNYSEVTGSFAAYKSDSDHAYLLYEDSPQIQGVFLEIGEECDDNHRSRPVRYVYERERWCFFHTREKTFAWRKEYGYPLPKGMALHKSFPNSYFSVLNEDGFSELGFYDANRGEGKRTFGKNYYFNWFSNPNYRFESIELNGYHLICKSVGHFYYVFSTNTHDITPLCSSITKPVIGKGYIIISDGDHQQIFMNHKMVENRRWSENCQLFVEGDYVFCQNGDNNTWKIYWLKNGEDVYTGWRNIKVEKKENGEIRLLVDTNDIIQLERTIVDIASTYQRWMNKMRQALPKRPESPIVFPPQNSQQISDDTVSLSQDNTDAEGRKEVVVSTNSPTGSSFPDHIDFIVALKKVKTVKDDGKFIDSNRQHKQFNINDIILWYDLSSFRLYVTKYKRIRTYQVLFTKENVTESILIDNIPSSFTRVDLKDFNENNLIEKLLSLYEVKISDEVSINKQKINLFLSGMGFDEQRIQNAIEVLYPKVNKDIVQETQRRVNFNFKDKEYSLCPNDIWAVDNPFYRHKYLQKADYIAILIGDNFTEHSSDKAANYELIGQGSDKRFDQDFGTPVNKDIRDHLKRVLLFKEVDGCFVFFDEVESVGYSVVLEDVYDKDSRKLIKFHLRSLIRNIN